jgi:hypothetical protein
MASTQMNLTTACALPSAAVPPIETPSTQEPSMNATSRQTELLDPPSAAPADTIRLPNGIWEVIGSNPGNADLKQARLVNSVFNDFAVSHLFKSVCFSIVPESRARFLRLSREPKPSQRVQCLSVP